MYISHTGRLGDLGAAFDGEMTPRDDFNRRRLAGLLAGRKKIEGRLKPAFFPNRRFFLVSDFCAGQKKGKKKEEKRKFTEGSRHQVNILVVLHL